MSLYDLQITGPVLHAQENVDQRTTRISRLSDQLADLQLDLAREVRALRADQDELRAAIKRQTDALAKEQGRRLRGQ